MKTQYSSIVCLQDIGKQTNSIQMNEILRMANLENLKPSREDQVKRLLLCIDLQQDFMDNGALGVPGAIQDVNRISQFLYKNVDKITDVVSSIDTHTPHQIFHPCWWIDENGVNPPPYTAISLADLDSGKWRAIIDPIGSRDYVEHLEKDGKKMLVVWTYHCLQGTSGAALENQFANMAYFHSVARKTVMQRVVKGQDPVSEMYGIIKPEYDKKGYVDIALLNKLEKYDEIYVVGEAKSHCVYESLNQILEFFKSRPDVTSKITILEDCMSSIPSYEASTDAAFDSFKTTYKVNIKKSTDIVL